MKIIEVEQRSGEWLKLRNGRPTASGMRAIVTSEGKPAKGAKRNTYAHELVYERIAGATVPRFITNAMERGTAIEPDARGWYEMGAAPVVEVGFCLSDCGRWGCSPDGLVGSDGSIEIKHRVGANLVAALRRGACDPDHWVQVQAVLWITEREWCDYIVWPDVGHALNFKPACWRCERDEAVIDCLREQVPAFCDELEAVENAVRENMQ